MHVPTGVKGQLAGKSPDSLNGRSSPDVVWELVMCQLNGIKHSKLDHQATQSTPYHAIKV